MTIMQWIAATVALFVFLCGGLVWWLFAKDDGEWGLGRLFGFLLFIICTLVGVLILVLWVAK